MDGQKCAHPPCSCYVDLGQLYCGPRCKEHEQRDPDEASHELCGCRHEECVTGIDDTPKTITLA